MLPVLRLGWTGGHGKWLGRGHWSTRSRPLSQNQPQAIHQVLGVRPETERYRSTGTKRWLVMLFEGPQRRELNCSSTSYTNQRQKRSHPATLVTEECLAPPTSEPSHLWIFWNSPTKWSGLLPC